MLIKSILIFCGCLLTTWFVYPKLIPFLKRIKYGQTISQYSLDDYKQKEGTPTMGGVAFVIIPVIFIVIIYPELFFDIKILLVIMAYVGYGLIGFVDDYIIVIKRDNAGL
ncbi:MAG: phospho-N-acetylmuramoyl-pentapeptide-transferase, partial [Erysipelotrichaceae bacterium]|nr:phospho-N-acetylmuramoyl-pentapeptide-transferase [Erysipelotrichaceae bacterium]